MTEVRAVGEAEYEGWLRAVATGFLRPPVLEEGQVEAFRRQTAASRLLGAFDGGRCVATFRSFPQEVTAVGGSAVPANAISAVTVAPTHRRRGLLSRMMGQDLAAAGERGDVVATLIAAEHPIYGRYGFGPATRSAEWTVEVSRAGLDRRWSGPGDGGRIDLVDGEDVRKLGPELYERVRRSQPGAVSRTPLWWEAATGAVRFGTDWTEPFYAVYRSASGEVDGMVSYRTEDTWRGNQPDCTATVNWLTASTPAAQGALWHYVCSIDWITRVESGRRGPDDLLPDLLPDPRAARLTTYTDWLWVRILDVVRALEARAYEGEGALVLEVVDGGGVLPGGRFRLEAGPQGASCTPTRAGSVDLTLDVGELARLWLGGESALRLAALGRVQEEREGAARKADALFRSAGRPWCPDLF
ncbi:GNAT family N-acetyltransferase [Streptomyces pluripotens]|uniref:GNAT family N-acetyltransferase n=1 Tax=Streptomyces pluripotens TaxID=1355015 RepID=A0A221P105_9ACTN|nr:MULTISPECIES: GNAT family N-acetyltransferase [Streptomyces]ARP71467.1 GNAT family N-acetyltransferase [Streptomyces pluripotens]ASN25718.1 GNAT family N-acetyltransferase [Streptomyces pluripotens]KIE25037.1 hypothetical protein LK08_21110 [Streptomyces sp. MUSC 125]MCH0560130.1 GNAT family N-acetyltransferase [Streptomyces sp. MUM 16J]